MIITLEKCISHMYHQTLGINSTVVLQGNQNTLSTTKLVRLCCNACLLTANRNRAENLDSYYESRFEILSLYQVCVVWIALMSVDR